MYMMLVAEVGEDIVPVVQTMGTLAVRLDADMVCNFNGKLVVYRHGRDTDASVVYRYCRETGFSDALGRQLDG